MCMHSQFLDMTLPFWTVAVGCVEQFLWPRDAVAWLKALPAATRRMLKPMLDRLSSLDVHVRLAIAAAGENEDLARLSSSNTPLMWLEHLQFASVFLGRTARVELLVEVLVECWVCASPL